MTAPEAPRPRAREWAPLAAYVERGELPGWVAAVAHGDTARVEVCGRQAEGDARPMARDSIFRIASMSKPIVAVAALRLVEECRLRLDDSIEPWLPELAHRRVLRRPEGPIDDTIPARRAITVRDLFTFRLGTGTLLLPPRATPIQRAMDDRALGQGAPAPALPPEPDEWMRRLGELPLIYQPGERWLYSTGADVLGVLVARVAGRPLEEFLEDWLFEPLGMRDTAFWVPEEKRDRFTTSYSGAGAAGGLRVLDDARTGQWTQRPRFPSAAGGLVSTIDDVLAFARCLAHGGRAGRRRLLGRNTLRAFVTDQLTEAQRATSGWPGGFFETHGWGLGVAVVTRALDPTASLGSYGWDGGLGTTWQNDPVEDLTTILLTGRAMTSPEPPPIYRDFRTIAYRSSDAAA